MGCRGGGAGGLMNPISILRMRAPPVAGGGSLSAAISTSSAAFNYGTAGFTDWALWMMSTITGAPAQRKSGGGSTISNAATYGPPAGFTGYNGETRILSWTGGTPGASGSSDEGNYNNGNDTGTGLLTGLGIIFSMPADTTLRAFRIDTSTYQGTIQVGLHLSDSSAPDYLNTAAFSAGAGAAKDGVITGSYKAVSSGQSLIVSLEVAVVNAAGANVTINGAGYA